MAKKKKTKQKTEKSKHKNQNQNNQDSGTKLCSILFVFSLPCIQGF
jgi:hypothetical protein